VTLNKIENALQLPSGGEYRQTHLEHSDDKKEPSDMIRIFSALQENKPLKRT